jgi:acid phosphatase (class A)
VKAFSAKDSSVFRFFLGGVVLSCFCLQTTASEQGPVRKALPPEPIYLSLDVYKGMKEQMLPPPATGSDAYKQDEKQLFALQKSRTERDCQRAAVEGQLTFKAFFGKPYGPLTDSEVNYYEPLFKIVKADTYYFNERLKADFPRNRPYTYIKDLKPCLPKESSMAYPSGHAAISRIMGKLLGELMTDRKEVFENRGKQIGEDRALAGLHHPSDVEAGKAFGEIMYKLFKESSKFEEELKKIKSAPKTSDH